eukprot:CAMPEP_0119102794 /NCGR_PEP_ID=MMETSP1180-20130426/1414_1 /TAXON_ID=3052 ORGANISM="Chlamydomonas cf sp, Strain CCMP681" /NCGR_SAMPLE_ID=MMETSP1180 /ASSEMBLY_ACC=CAM_ASM_000741 /LENGTH=122 /DNA_ID=CAMNT_0007087141 /DNA_START=1190 /DNA_END=1558 /DNA_ORIENTATION=+
MKWRMGTHRCVSEHATHGRSGAALTRLSGKIHLGTFPGLASYFRQFLHLAFKTKLGLSAPSLCLRCKPETKFGDAWKEGIPEEALSSDFRTVQPIDCRSCMTVRLRNILLGLLAMPLVRAVL